ncbi:hypothetical protein HD806DRAFT_538167 [Xylariaceae sp. AK1471]|nr:hypothetical protein HD806DRAFT_538167 [Xylariaceae sp. AK1471]
MHGYECDTPSEEGVKPTGWCASRGLPLQRFPTNIDNRITGRIFMVSSMSRSIVNRPQKYSAYNASKPAHAQLMKSLAVEWAPHGIRVNALSQDYIQTAANEGEEMKKLIKEWIKHIPMSRITKREDFRGTVVWIVSDVSSYLTASEAVVDDGYLAW